MESIECSMKRDPDDAEALTEPVCVPVNVEPNFEGTAEDVIEENFEATENSEGTSREYEVRENDADAETLTEPFFVQVKAEPDFQETSEETFVAEDSFEASEFTEVASSSTLSPPSGTLGGHSQRRCYEDICSSEYRTGLHQSFQFPGSCCVASCSAEDKAAKRDLLERHREEHAAEVAQHTDQSEDGSCNKNEHIHFQREMLRFGSIDQTEEGTGCSTGKINCSQKPKLLQQTQMLTNEMCFRCSKCGKTFKKKCDLSRHARIHTGKKPFRCSQCGKSFCDSSNLSQHMRTHTDERPFKCNQCHNAFSDSSTLTKHIRTHSGEKPFKCNLCGRAFKRCEGLAEHMRTHTGDKPFKCSQCEKSFARSSGFRVHMQIHSGERHFACALCGKCFKTSSNLSSHELRVHPAASAS